MFYCSYISIHYIICECGDTFSTEEELKVHLSKEHNNKLRIERNEYKCDTCDKIFGSEKACLIHQRMHTNPRVRRDRELDKKKYYTLKNIVCEVCGKQYASNAALRYHQRVHTGERPYRCSMCPKSFTMPLFLQIHTRTHTGERPYECQHCPKAFSNKAALLRHDRVHTGVKPYECPQCGKFFTQSNSMKLHVRTVHLKLPAPYKSKNRKGKGRHGSTMHSLEDFHTEHFVSEVKMERDYEEMYQDNEDYQVYQTEESPYGEIKVESAEVAMYDNEEQLEVLYEEVYEVQEV